MKNGGMKKISAITDVVVILDKKDGQHDQLYRPFLMNRQRAQFWNTLQKNCAKPVINFGTKKLEQFNFNWVTAKIGLNSLDPYLDQNKLGINLE